MFKAGINPIEVLLWSRTATLAQVISTLELVGKEKELDLKSRAEISYEAPPYRVHFEEDDEKKHKMKCPEKNCSFLTSLPKDYGEKYFVRNFSKSSDPGRYRRLVALRDHKESHGW